MNTLELEHRFEEIYGKRAEHTYFAPGRVNLIGEHTDYNGGLVFPCALSFGTYLLIAKREDRQNRFSSVNMDRSYTANANAFEDKPTAWIKYPIGVMKEFAERGSDVWGYDLLYYGNIPNGAGLSSSASIEVVTAVMLNDVTKVHLDMTELVKISQKAENDYVGVNCGIMDQFAVGMGKANHAIALDCASLKYEYVPLHVHEHARVKQAIDALKAGKLTTFGQLMNASHRSLKDDYEVTGIELDTLAEEGQQLEGVLGSRMTGAGFGGCTVTLIQEEQVDRYIREVGKIYKDKTHLEATFYIADIGEGARKLN